MRDLLNLVSTYFAFLKSLTIKYNIYVFTYLLVNSVFAFAIQLTF